MPFASRSLAAVASILSLTSFVMAADDLGGRLMSGDSVVRTAAVEELQKADPRVKRGAITTLRQALGSGPAQAEIAAQALAALGGYAESAVPELVEALRYDEESVFPPVKQALANSGAAAVRPLSSALQDGNWFVRRRAAEALGAIGPKASAASPALAELLQDPQFEVRNAAEEALSKLGPTSLNAVAGGLKSQDENVRRATLSRLSKFGPSAIPLIANVLKKDPSPYVRATAAEALGEVKDGGAQAQQVLLSALTDLDEGVRGAAVDGLGAMGPNAKEAAGPLFVMAQDDKEALVRQKALQAAERIGAPTVASMPGLVKGFRSPNVETRLSIIRSMTKAELAVRDAAPVLAAAMKDRDPGVRIEGIKVAAALAKDTEAAMPALRTGLSDADENVRRAAARTLGESKGAAAPAAAAALTERINDREMVVRSDIVTALAKLGEHGVPGLVQATRDQGSVTADEATEAIRRMGTEAVPALERMQQGSDEILKKRATDLLAAMQSRGAMPPKARSKR
jgi:HEAT repeat protein